jgi:hypothetical protein
MSSATLTGNDTIQVAGRNLVNFGDGDVAKLTFPNDLVGAKVGKNGNAIFNLNASGQLCDLELRVLRGSSDDSFLSNLLILMTTDLPSFPLMAGYFVKRLGDGNGNIKNDTYLLGGGVFTKKVEVSENVEGNTDPAIALYRLKFSNSDRAQF